MPPLSGIIFSRHIWYECIQKSPFHLDCMGFNLILLLIKKIRCSIFNNRKASLHRTQWLRLNWRLCIPFAVLEEHSYSNKSWKPWFMLHSNVQLYAQSETAMQLQFYDNKNEQHDFILQLLQHCVSNHVFLFKYSMSLKGILLQYLVLYV